MIAAAVYMAGPEAIKVSFEYLARQIRSTNIISKLPTIDPINGRDTFKILLAIPKSMTTLFEFNVMPLDIRRPMISTGSATDPRHVRG